jgi:uncharacterized protein (DUF885 family)
MQERLALAVERYDAGDTTSDLDVIDSWMQYVRELFDLIPAEGQEAAATVAKRMAAVPEAYQQFPQILLGTAWEFLWAHSSWDEKRLRFELHRYLGWPGQVPSYELGERVWLQASEEAKARAGGAFSLKDFHSKALSLGAMGLDPLREALSRC